MRWIGLAVVSAALGLLVGACIDSIPVADDHGNSQSGAGDQAESERSDAEQAEGLWEGEEEPPDDLGGGAATRLLYYPYVNSQKYPNLCGEEVSETYPDDALVPHGLSADSELPESLVNFLEAGEGFSLAEYEYRWFEEERIVLFTRTRHGPDHSVVAAVVEIGLFGPDPPAWGVMSAGGRYICME